MAESKTTGKSAASKASKTLLSKSSGPASKTAAGSALAQVSAPRKSTSASAAQAASKMLQDGRNGGASKSAAGSALSQKAPSNSRTIKNPVKTGTVSRSAARSAAKAVSSKRS